MDLPNNHFTPNTVWYINEYEFTINENTYVGI